MANTPLEIDSPSLTDKQYSYQHAKAFGLHNHIFVDRRGDIDLVYVVDDDFRVISYKVAQSGRDLPLGKVVYEIPSLSSCDGKNNEGAKEEAISSCCGRVPVTLMFADEERAMLSDGCGRLFLLETADRRSQQIWQLLYSCEVSTCVSRLPSKLVDCVTFACDVETSNASRRQVECLCVAVEDNDDTGDGDKSSNSGFLTALYWLNFGLDDNGVWRTLRRRLLHSTAPPDLATLPSTMECRNRLVVSGEKQFSFVSDSLIPVVDVPVETDEDKELRECPPAYTWSQTRYDISAQFTLPLSQATKSHIICNMTRDTIELAIKDGDSLLCGELPENIDVCLSNWTLEGQRLEINLEKKAEGTWPILVCGDTRGKMCLSDKQTDTIHNRLRMMAEGNEVRTPSITLTSPNRYSILRYQNSEFKKPAYNTQDLEECDRQGFNGATLTCYHGDTHQQLYQSDLLGNQWLFNCPVQTTMPRSDNDDYELTSVDLRPALCIRHDVDGVVFEFANSDPVWTHIATFNALGYVMASKNAKKFSCMSPDMSYSAIADSRKHVYVYWRETAVETSLRNRKTGLGQYREFGVDVPTVARQQLIALPANKHGDQESIIGLHLQNNRIYILTHGNLFFVQMKS